jgi:zinc/manganese transport system ATP-binding protein
MHDMTQPPPYEREAELQALPVSEMPLDVKLPPREQSRCGSIVALQGAAVQLGARTIWSQATFQVTPGEFIAILGPNGAGKSTLLRVLLGLLRPSAGRVEVLGSAPRRGHPAIGYVPQRRTLDPDLPVRGRDLVMLGLDGRHWGFALPGPKRQKQHALVNEALAAVGATAYADRPVGQLSGGEQQRLLLAQALVGQPSLLLLDEPLASLDLRNQVAIANLVARVAREQGMTVLLVTHDVNPLLPVLDRVLYVAHGQALIGPPAEIITTESLTRLYGAPVEVVRDSRGRVFVVGLEQELMSPSAG